MTYIVPNPISPIDFSQRLSSFSRLILNLCAAARHPFSPGRRRNYRQQLRRDEITNQSTPSAPSYRPSAPNLSLFEQIRDARSPRNHEPDVDIIVPVYKGHSDTLACIASVLLSKNETEFELILIDDGSPDEALVRDLELLSTYGLFTFLRNETNLGFVKTVNRGMQLHPKRDVLLLNSDTLVFNNWLDRIRSHALKEKVATVTPFTNNGTICSYPHYCRDNSAPFHLPYEAVDNLAATVNSNLSVDVPTGVGFCMYIRRSALDEIGLFDEETFGKGYGEENDFCMRAQEKGWRNVHALDTFVFHSGETSFDAAASRKKKALEAIAKKHPTYMKLIHSFIADDPARLGRMRLDTACLLRRHPTSSILCFTHWWGGGIERYLLDRAQQLKSEGIDLLVARPAESGSLKACISVYTDTTPFGTDFATAPNLQSIDLVNDQKTLSQFLRFCRTTCIEVHNTVGWSSTILKTLPDFAKSNQLPYKVTLHDYIAICPQIHLIDKSNFYCGEKGVAQCNECLRHRPDLSFQIHPDRPHIWSIVEWRSAYYRFLQEAAEVAAPSADTAQRIQKYFPTLHINIEPHDERTDHILHCAVPFQVGQRLRVVIIGAIVSHKGSSVVRACAADAARRKLPIDFVIVGYANEEDLHSYPNVTITGRYREHEVSRLLLEQKAHVAFLPSIWPETYCYTLSIALAAGFPTIAFDIGAPAERLRRAGGDHMLLGLELATCAELINDHMFKFANKLLLKSSKEDIRL